MKIRFKSTLSFLIILLAGLVLVACGYATATLPPVTTAATTQAGGLNLTPVPVVTYVPIGTVTPGATTTSGAVVPTATTTAPATTAATTVPAALPSIRQTKWQDYFTTNPRFKADSSAAISGKPLISLIGSDVAGYPQLDNIVYLDLDGDKTEEAALPFFSGGTAGNLWFLVFRQTSGGPLLLDYASGYKLSLTIENGLLTAVSAIYAGWEPNCCPSGFSHIAYTLENNRLKEVASRTEGYPEAQPEAIEHFYNLLNGKQYADAYKVLSPAFRKVNPYDPWVAGYKNTSKVEVKATKVDGIADSWQVLIDSVDSGTARQFSGIWKLSWFWNNTDKGWLLDTADIRPVIAGTGTGADSGGGATKINAIFQPLLADLKNKTSLPVYLPGNFPGSDQKAYASIQKADANGYNLEIALAPDCNGAGACHFGSITAGKFSAGSPLPPGSVIFLAKNLTGYFSPSQCGASCSDGELTWRNGTVQYSVAIKGINGDNRSLLEGLIKMANSAILLGPQ